MDNIKILYFPVGRQCETVSFEEMDMNARNGEYSVFTPFIDNIAVVYSHKQAVFNRAMRIDNKAVPMFGDFYLLGIRDGKPVELTSHQIGKYSEMFRYPEGIMAIPGMPPVVFPII